VFFRLSLRVQVSICPPEGEGKLLLCGRICNLRQDFRTWGIICLSEQLLTSRNLADLEERFSDLNETLLGELHDMIQPYILRRIKADVLRLPPKVS
jgi:SNF2 family DNA or RNA helicase